MEYKTQSNIKVDLEDLDKPKTDSQGDSTKLRFETLFFLYENLYLKPIQAKFNGIDLSIKMSRLPFDRELEIYCRIHVIKDEKDFYDLGNIILEEIESYKKIDGKWFDTTKDDKEVKLHDIIGVNYLELCFQFYNKNMTSILEIEELKPLFPKVDDRDKTEIGIKNKLMFFNLYRKMCYIDSVLVEQFNFNILTLWDKLNYCDEIAKLSRDSYSQLLATATGFGANTEYKDYFNKLDEISKGNLSGMPDGYEKGSVDDLIGAVEKGKKEQAELISELVGKTMNEKIEYLNKIKNKSEEDKISNDTMLLSEDSLSETWMTDEEKEAWKE